MNEPTEYYLHLKPLIEMTALKAHEDRVDAVGWAVRELQRLNARVRELDSAWMREATLHRESAERWAGRARKMRDEHSQQLAAANALLDDMLQDRSRFWGMSDAAKDRIRACLSAQPAAPTEGWTFQTPNGPARVEYPAAPTDHYRAVLEAKRGE